MKPVRTLAALFIAASLAIHVAYAQGIGASGEITGIVTDPQGSVLAHATVIAKEAGRGYQYKTETDTTGQYQIYGLPPTVYDVTAEQAGFQTGIQKSLVVNIGQTVTLDFRLKVSQVAERVEVTTEPPIVEIDKGEQSNIITNQYITDLPIDRRNYLTYTLLAPGVSNSVHIAGSQDYRVVQTPQSGLSFYGSNGRGNTVTIDGGEANDDAGGVRLTLSQEGVQEFQVNRSNYSASLGGASGANINIVTKSGTNHYHGTLFGFFRNDALDAQDTFSYNSALPVGALSAATGFSTTALATPVKNTLSRQQFGGSFGGPMALDKSFFFFSYEGLRDSEQKSVPLLLNSGIFAPENFFSNNQQAIISGLAAQGVTPVPCLTGQPALPSAVCAGILTNILTINPASSPLSAFLVNKFERNSGLSPFQENSDLGSVRFDHQFDSQNQFFLRFNAGRDDSQNLNAQGLTGIDRGNAIHQADYTLQGSLFHTFSASLQNEFRVQGNLSRFNALPNDPGGPGFTIQGFAFFGRDKFLPSLTKMNRYDFADNVTLVRGRHTMNFGGDVLVRRNETASQTFMAGEFNFGALPGGVLSPCLQVPAACGLTAKPALLDSLQSFSLGLPQYYEQGFGTPTQTSVLPFYSFFWQDQWKAASNFTATFGARYELDERYVINTYPLNFSPRASFAWDPFKDHKTVIRGGIGMFTSPVYFQIDDVVASLGVGVNGNRPIANGLIPINFPGTVNSATIFQTLFAQGALNGCHLAPGQFSCITPAQLNQFAVAPGSNYTVPTSGGPLSPGTVLFGAQSDYRNPFSVQGEFGIEREIAPGFSVSASGIYVNTQHLPVALDSNLLATAPNSAPFSLASGQSVVVQNWNTSLPNALGSAPCAGAAIFTCFGNPAILQNNIYSSKGTALYYGGIFEAKKRFSDHVSLLGNYTFSRAIDTTTDFNSDFSPQNEIQLKADRALSDFDERHKIVVAGVLDSPWHNPIASGFELNPIFNYNSGHPFNLLTGTDVNGDHHPNNDRPIGAGRNTGQGPDYLNVDLRLARRFRTGEKSSLELTAEAFNILNRTNYGTINNVAGANALLPLSAPGGRGLVTDVVSGVNNPFTVDPNVLRFVTVNPKRELQFGARFSF